MKKNIETNLNLLLTKQVFISYDQNDNEIYFDPYYILNKYYGGIDNYIIQVINFKKEQDKYKDRLWLQPKSLEQLMGELDMYQVNSSSPIDKNPSFKYISKKIDVQYDEESDEYYSDIDQMIQYGYLFYEDNTSIGYSLNTLNHIVGVDWVNDNTETLKHSGIYHITTQDELDELTFAFGLGEFLASTIEVSESGDIEQPEILVDGYKNIYYFPKQKEMVIGINNLEKDCIGIDKIFEDTI